MVTMKSRFKKGGDCMPLKDKTKREIQQGFEKIMAILDAMDHKGNGDDALNGDDEALKYVEWLNVQTELRYGTVDHDGVFNKVGEERDFPIVPSGIYWAYLGRNIGHEMNKHRPVLVMRAEANSGLCTVIPLTKERLNDGYWFHIDLEHQNNTAVVEQMKVISKGRLDKPMRIEGEIVSASETDLERIYKQIRLRYATPKKRKERK